MVAHGARYQNATALDHIQVSSQLEEKIHWVISRLFDGQGRGSILATRRFIDMLDNFRPDLVHIHNLHGCYINYSILFEYLHDHDIPAVWTLHDCWAFTGHCTYFNRVACENWKNQCRNCPISNDFPASLLDLSYSNYRRKRRLFSSLGSLTIVPVSKWLGGLVRDSFLHRKEMKVIYNGIDTQLFKPQESHFREQYGMESKYILLGVATGFGERKGLTDYFKLSSMLPDEYRIVLVGATPQEIETAPAGILMLPKTKSASELAEIYSVADVVLSLSYEETFGLTPIEGMACGTPAIVYDNTAQPEHITPETGCIVATGNLEQLKTAVIAVCRNGKAAYSKACRRRAIEFYEKDLCFEQYIDLYDQILKR